MVSNGAKIDILSWDGTLSSSDFRFAALAFAEKWNRFNLTALPQWSWIPCPKHHWIAAHEGEGYLSLEDVLLHRSGEEDQGKVCHTGKEEPSCSGPDDAIDNAVLVQSSGYEEHRYDFHIVYSSSYKVPVLYFRGCCSDGQPLVLNDIEKDLPLNSAKVLMESKWTFITQQEHPYLNRPWYTLHPCGTSEWMKLLLVTDTDKDVVLSFQKYVGSWLSVVGLVVGLTIPFQFFHHIYDNQNYQ
ncbi:E2-like conjugating enzyme atg10 [Sarracenia purpurea var. burkii]